MSDNEPAAHPRVLIVDDSRMVRASITRLIRDAYEVREEGDGEAGWQTLLLDPTLQVVISDLSSPSSTATACSSASAPRRSRASSRSR